MKRTTAPAKRPAATTKRSRPPTKRPTATTKGASPTAKTKAGKPTTIDQYLATVPTAQRTALEQLRRAIHALVPGVEECISYGLPAFREDGRVIAGFSATRRGCSYYPFSGRTLATVKGAIAGYGGTKSALHFDAPKGLPKALVRRLLDARRAE